MSPERRAAVVAQLHQGADQGAERASMPVDREVEVFLFHEARLLDERRFAEWEALWTDDGVYWVPSEHEPYDPATRVSLAYDDRATLAKRIARLTGSDSHAEQPPPVVRRIVSNVEVGGVAPDGRLMVESNFVAVGSRRDRIDTFAGRTTHHLVRTGTGLEIAFKKVVLVNCDAFLAHLPFLP